MSGEDSFLSDGEMHQNIACLYIYQKKKKKKKKTYLWSYIKEQISLILSMQKEPTRCTMAVC
jgi:hypothetical protein